MTAPAPATTEALFYHLERHPLEVVLPQLLLRTLERGWRAVVQAGSEERLEAAVRAGIREEHVCLDPGIGFGKSLQDNLSLLNGLAMFHGLGCPILLGASRMLPVARAVAAYPDLTLACAVGGTLLGIGLAGGWHLRLGPPRSP